MKKKGQLSVLMLIGIVIVVLVVIVSYVKYSSTRKEISAEVGRSISSDYKPVISYAQEIFRQSAINGISRLGLQGGRISSFPDGSALRESSGISVAYGLKTNLNPQNRLPGIADMGAELSDYVEEEIQKLSFGSFEEIGFEIGQPESSAIKVEAKIREDSIVFDITYPLKIKSGDSEHSEQSFSVVIPSGLKKIHEYAGMLIGSQNSEGSIVKHYFDNKDYNQQHPDAPIYFDMSQHDFSCDRIRASFEDGKFIKFFHYSPFALEPGYTFQFAVDYRYIYNAPPKSLTSLGKINADQCP